VGLRAGLDPAMHLPLWTTKWNVTDVGSHYIRGTIVAIFIYP